VNAPVPAKRRPTQADVARVAGVSQAVVSFVLNDNPPVSISAETRQRVRAAIEQLGYVPNGTARSLRTRKTLTIAALIPDITNPFYPAFERGIQDIADARDYDLVIYNTDGVRAKELKCLRSVQRGRADGVIIKPVELTARDFQPLLDLYLPIVVYGDLPGEAGPFPFDHLVIDAAAVARAIVTHLVDRGHTRIGMIVGPWDVPGPQERISSYRQVLAERRIPVADILIRASDFTEVGGAEATRQLIGQSPPPTAIFAANDLLAMGALIALREAGLRVPEDVAVVGIDDIPAAKLMNPPLTTVALFPARIGRRAAEMVFERLAGSAPQAGRREVMPFELIVRSSA
jgi:LacI family transcriptional regulator